MAKAFLLHLMEAYLFANGGVFVVANPLLGFWGGTEGQLGASMSYLSLLHPRHSQPGHFAVACRTLEAP